jgi:hypothetical protein
MNKLSTEKRVQILRCLVEGNSIRATSRMTDTAFNSVVKLLIDAGRACSMFQDKTMRNLKCKRVQVGRNLELRLREGKEHDSRNEKGEERQATCGRGQRSAQTRN